MTTVQDIQRSLTSAFIADDPTSIILTPQQVTTTAGGGRTMVPGTPRAAQTFKLIPMTFDQRPTVTAGGVERIIDYTLLGEWDSVGAVWDKFDLGDPNEYFLVVAIAPGHGYERKYLCERHLYQDGVA
jgi:hypothetical protein